MQALWAGGKTDRARSKASAPTAAAIESSAKPAKRLGARFNPEIAVQDAALFFATLAIVFLLALQLGTIQGGGETDWHGLLLQVASTLTSIGLLLYGMRGRRERKREIERRLAAERHALELALQDQLTSLPNRRRFEAELSEALTAAPRAGASHAVLLLDLNGFKGVNDVFGHAAGDLVLVNVASRLKAAIGPDHLVARIGGDEFALLAPNIAGPEEATSIAMRLIGALEEPVAAGMTEHQIGIGIGIALCPQDADDEAELLRKADIALYRAKAEKRSALCFFEPEMDVHVRERAFLERELRSAIGTDAMSPHYQPQVDLDSGRVIGFEALARWSHPTLGNIAPDRFIPIAEECGLIRELTEHLLGRACRDAATWPADISLAFNISPVQMTDRTLGLRILSILAEHGLPPGRLEIEITESALVRDLEAARDVISALRSAGVKIALDDFGTGYSSLYHLRSIKFDKIKIDRSFVQSMQASEESEVIVRALLGLGLGLGIAVTAEGVENATERRMLLAGGCRLGQGFLFSKALPGPKAIDLLGQPPLAA